MRAGMENDGFGPAVETHDHRVMPGRVPVRTEVLQHDDGMARRNFVQEFIRPRDDVAQAGVAAGAGDQSGLQAALAVREVDLADKVVHRDLVPGPGQDHGHGRRAALVFFLGKKGDIIDDHPVGQAGGFAEQSAVAAVGAAPDRQHGRKQDQNQAQTAS